MKGNVVSVAAGNTDVAIAGINNHYLGFSLKNTSGATTTVYVRNGTDATGGIVDVISLLAGETAGEYYADGISCPLGIFLDRDGANNVEGAIYWG